MGNDADYANNVDGIPLPGDIPQVEGSAAPNEPRSYTLENPEGDSEGPYAVGYFRAEEANLGKDNGPFVRNKDQLQWSAGEEDEENSEGYVSFVQLDNDWDEGVYPETEPLTVEAQPAGLDDSKQFEEILLEPDNVEYGEE